MILRLIFAIELVIMDLEFENGLREFNSSSAVLTERIGNYILDSGGKRLRPRLVLMIADKIGLERDVALPLAYSVELMHTASLLHDDVVDGTKMRRSRPTANQVFGDKPALLTGDFISASAMELILGLKDIRIAVEMVRTIKKMAEGELNELEYAKKFHRSKDIYFDIIYKKTAVLFEFCTMAPGMLAGLGDKDMDILSTYGRNIGMAFQIVDDIINLAPKNKDTKDAYNDITEGKSTLPLIYLFNKMPDIMEALNANTNPEDRKANLIPLIDHDVLHKSTITARSFSDKAVSVIYNTSLDTEEARQIPEIIMSQVDGRF